MTKYLGMKYSEKSCHTFILCYIESLIIQQMGHFSILQNKCKVWKILKCVWVSLYSTLQMDFYYRDQKIAVNTVSEIFVKYLLLFISFIKYLRKYIVGHTLS